MAVDPLQRLDRAIKIIAMMISLLFITLIGLRVFANRAGLHLPNPKHDCELAGRRYDDARKICLPPHR